MLRILGLAFAIAFAATGCGLQIDSGEVACGPAGECPEGFECRYDGLCYRPGIGLSLTCGNDKTEPGETCDPIEACPTQCDDGNACTADTLIGHASECNAACLHDPISACVDGDGCCPEACDSSTDSDCSATCGNGTIDDNETCDPATSCVQSCNDGNACTVDIKNGSAKNCNVSCSYEQVTACTDGDGCCPAACDANTDSDCSASCGNGEIEANETCDPPGSCPTTCNDSNSCTIDTVSGNAANCNVSCSYTTIQTCKDGDGCCPPGCNAGSDDDCSATCGNQTIEPGETCDPPGSCPTTCDDGNACTINTLMGSAQNCNVRCDSVAIVSCANGDGCCPVGCTSANDSDCSASCGNGTVESPQETCDPTTSCPTTCDDGNGCTIDIRTGSAALCNVRCSYELIQECIYVSVYSSAATIANAADGCCPNPDCACIDPPACTYFDPDCTDTSSCDGDNLCEVPTEDPGLCRFDCWGCGDGYCDPQAFPIPEDDPFFFCDADCG